MCAEAGEEPAGPSSVPVGGAGTRTRLTGRDLHHPAEEEETSEGSAAASRLLRDEDDGEDYMMAAEEDLTHFRLCPRRWAGPEHQSHSSLPVISTTNQSRVRRPVWAKTRNVSKTRKLQRDQRAGMKEPKQRFNQSEAF